LQAKEVAQQAFALCGERFTTSERQHYDGQLYGERNSKCFKYFFGCRNSKVEQSDFDMYVQAFASTVDATHIGNVTRSIKPGVEFLTSSS
jgi:hypothetical protein